MKKKSPNVLLLFPDQHRGDWLPYDQETFNKMGMEPLPLRMPNLRKLMDEGMTFPRTVSSSPVCAPARACLASGRRYDDCGVKNNSYNYPTDKKTFYSVLRESDYNVCSVGKLDLHKATKVWGLDGWSEDLGEMGFTHAMDHSGKLASLFAALKEPSCKYTKYLYDNNLEESHIKDYVKRFTNIFTTDPVELPEEAYSDNYVTDEAIEILDKLDADKPWFMQVNFSGPHDPWDVTERMRKRWENVQFPKPNMWDEKSTDDINGLRQNYAAELENIDRCIGQILKLIEEKGELDNTVIIYSADHGEMLGDFNLFLKSQPNRGAVNIPLVISGPGIQQGIVSNSLVELQDLAATIVGFSGSEMPEAKESVSLEPVLKGEKQEHREYQISKLIRSAAPNKNKAGNKDFYGKMFKYMTKYGDMNLEKSTIMYSDYYNWAMIADSQYKFIVKNGTDYVLYDIINDPWENNNIAENNADIVEKMLKTLYENVKDDIEPGNNEENNLKKLISNGVNLSTVLSENKKSERSNEMAFNLDTPLGEILDDAEGYKVLEKHMAEGLKNPMLAMAKGMSLKQIASMAGDKFPADLLEKVKADLEKL